MNSFKMKTKSIKCFCPKCLKYHKAKINWIGRGIPRVYCKSCKNIISKVSTNSLSNSGIKFTQKLKLPKS